MELFEEIDNILAPGLVESDGGVWKISMESVVKEVDRVNNEKIQNKKNVPGFYLAFLKSPRVHRCIPIKYSQIVLKLLEWLHLSG